MWTPIRAQIGSTTRPRIDATTIEAETAIDRLTTGSDRTCLRANARTKLRRYAASGRTHSSGNEPMSVVM